MPWVTVAWFVIITLLFCLAFKDINYYHVSYIKKALVLIIFSIDLILLFYRRLQVVLVLIKILKRVYQLCYKILLNIQFISQNFNSMTLAHISGRLSTMCNSIPFIHNFIYCCTLSRFYMKVINTKC